MPDLPKKDEVEDIFEEVDEGAGQTLPPSPAHKPERITPAQVVLEQQETGPKSKLFVKIILIIAAVLLLAAIAYTVWQYFSGQTDDVVVTNANAANTNDSNNLNVLNQNANMNQAQIDLNVAQLDKDRDGLLDQEEKELGTDLNSPDTDKDGLYDYEEVRVYLTDPKDADTDNDGYLDGEEVKNGYNPNGSGKLYNLNQALQNTNG